MDNLIKLLNPKAEKAKTEMWDRIKENRLEHLRQMYRESGNEKSKKNIVAISGLELDGGTCPICGNEWKEITFCNIYLAGRYYQPACECSVRCPFCHRFLYDEKMTGQLETDDICSNCGWSLIVNGQKRYGIEYEKYQFEKDHEFELNEKKSKKIKPKAPEKESQEVMMEVINNEN